MPIAERTIKNLFAKSQNRCANPDCYATLVIGETILAEICHIRARRKGGARYNPSLTEPGKNAAANLILLCPTCHTLVDKDKTGAFSVEWLEKIKSDHERHGSFEVTAAEARTALEILARYKARIARPKKKVVRSNASHGGIAVLSDATISGTSPSKPAPTMDPAVIAQTASALTPTFPAMRTICAIYTSNICRLRVGLITPCTDGLANRSKQNSGLRNEPATTCQRIAFGTWWNF